MTDERRPVAVALLSGGLDSTLAAKVILEQGITVVGINFAGAYCPRPFAGKSNAEKAAEMLGIKLVTLPIDAEFVAMVKRPKHGRGKNMNPCIDCHTLMIRKAWEFGQRAECRMQSAECKVQNAELEPGGEWKADFIITGEVLGQRPMSQNRNALNMVAKDSGVGDRLLRPLSAKLLEPTAVEVGPGFQHKDTKTQRGPDSNPSCLSGLVVNPESPRSLVDRERLLDIEGRQRTRQMALAERYGIKDYPMPAGGCLLTEKVYSKRLAEAFDHGEDSLEIVELLSLGRHFRLPSGARLVVGRDGAENDELLRREPTGAVVIDAGDLPGPVGLVISDSRLQIADCRLQDEELRLAARVCARYSDKRKEQTVKVKVADTEVTVQPAGEEETARLLIA
ncbi:MAG: tRNA 4-thiouridine(8) synthase ThiI [candidate division WOR-3 bacterium]|nr:tRNA 4-thiouridine(8) synthase ThiI [candidate division WOR-3 bacterium]